MITAKGYAAHKRANEERWRLVREREGLPADATPPDWAVPPRRVRFASGVERCVWPKNDAAREEARWLDERLGALAARAAEAHAAAPDATLAQLAETPIASLLAARTYAWLVTSPCAGLPYDPQADVEPPDWTLTLTAVDLVALARAFAAVSADAERVAAMRAAHGRDATLGVALVAFRAMRAEEVARGTA